MLPDLLRRLWRYLPLIALLVLAGGASAYLASKERVTYSAKASFRLLAGDPIASLTSTSATTSSGTSDGEALTQQESAVIGSEPMAQRIAERTGLTPAQVEGSLSIGADPASNVVRVSASAIDPTNAVAVVNAVLPAYNDYRNSVRKRQLATGIRILSRQAGELLTHNAELRRKVDNTASATLRSRASVRLQAASDRYDSVITKRNELIARKSAPAEAAIVLSRASASSVIPSATKRLGLLGAVLGGLLGIAIALVREQFRSVVRSPGEVAELTGMEVLARVPRLRMTKVTPFRRKLPVLRKPASALAESLRTLRAGLRHVGQDPVRVLLVTSPARGEGKSFIAANLAAVAAQGGVPTVLVSADLRHRTTDRLFKGLESKNGLGDLLVQGRSASLNYEAITQAVVQTPLDNLSVLLGGVPRGNPADLLAAGAIGRIFKTLTGRYDLVIIDAPPVLPVSDALLLAEHADVTLIVGAVDRTKQEELRQAADLLRRSGWSALRAVANGVGGRSSNAYGYRPKGVALARDESPESEVTAQR